MKKSKLNILLIIAMLCFAIVGCSSTEKTTENNEEEVVLENAEETDELETVITLVDARDKTIEMEKEAETIVSGYYITTYATIALGVENKVIGLEKKAETRPIYALSAVELIEKPQVGSLKEFSVEAVAELSPELVVLPVRLIESAEILEGLGFTVIVVDPETQEGLEEMLLLIGKATGTEERANELIEYYNETFEEIAEITTDNEKPSIYMASNSSYLETATSAMYQSELINKAGGENAFADLTDTYWTSISYESLLEKNPDFIIVPSGASYNISDVLNDSQLIDLEAVKNNNVYQMPKGFEEWDSPVPSSVLGVYWLASIINPEEITSESFVEKTTKFYEDFYDFTVDTLALQ